MSALEKFLELASKVVGPWATGKQGEAERENEWAMANLKAATLDIGVRARIKAETDYVRHQQNLEAITDQARRQLEPMGQKLLTENAGRPQQHDPDWFFRFSTFAADTSDEDIQALWAKVLAGEVVQPGRFSLRLLQLIGLMRKSDALDFERFANYLWNEKSERPYQAVNEAADSYLQQNYGMNDCFYFNLHEMGLIDASPLQMITLEYGKPIALHYGGNVYAFERTNEPGNSRLQKLQTIDMVFSLRSLTSLGKELYLLCDPVPDFSYVDRLTHGLTNVKCTATKT